MITIKMKNIYQDAISAVENGQRFRVSFKERSLKIDGKYIIEQGVFAGELGVEPVPREECLSAIEDLYLRYKHSVPSERSESKPQKYFRALSEAQLDDDDLLYGEHRDTAQIKLELYLLCQILNGFTWDTKTMGGWFWQSSVDSDLIILRDWVETN